MLKSLIDKKEGNPEEFGRISIKINDETQIIRQKSENDPQGRGAR